MIRRPASILALLTGLNLLNYLDRYVLSAVLSPLVDEFHLPKSIGGSLATVFLLGYFVTSPLFGVLADRAPKGGRKALLAGGIAVWSAATIGSGLARSPAALIVARAFVGVGEASYATIAPTLIDDVAPGDRRGRWLAIFYAAMPIGSAMGFIVGGGVLSQTHAWRNAFFIAGGPGLVLAALCLLIGEPDRANATHATQRPDLASSARHLVAPLYRKTVLGLCAYTFAIGGFAYWAPTYIHERYGLEPGRASSIFGMLTVVGGAVGTLVGGGLGDWAARRTVSDEGVVKSNLVICALSAGIGAPLALAAILAPTATGFFLAILPCEVALFLLNGPVNVATLRSVPPGLRASAMALSILAIHLLGDMWSPPHIWALADHMPMQRAMLLCPATFARAALVWWDRNTVKV